MRKRAVTLTDTIDFAANGTRRIDLPRSGFITHIEALLRLNVTSGASVTPAEDALARIVASARIRASGRSYFEVTDGRQWKYRNHFLYQGQLQEDALPGASATADVFFTMPIHWGFNPFDRYDAKIVIPARNLAELVMEVTWGAAADLGSGYTINSGEFTITVYEIDLDPGEKQSDFWTEGLLQPLWEPRIVDIPAVIANLGLEDEVPVTRTNFHTLIMVVDSTDARSDADVTEVGVKFTKRGEIPFNVGWRPLKAQSRTFFGLPADVVGVTLLPWELLSGRPVGLDLSLAQVGDVKLGFTTGAANGDLHILHYGFTKQP